MFFDVALLWKSGRASPSQGSSHSTGHGPTLSWMGWSGRVCRWSWACGYGYMKHIDRSSRRPVRPWRATSWRYSPTIKWRCGSLSTRLPITTSGNKCRSLLALAPTTAMPTEWKRVHRHDGYNFTCDRSSRVVFNYPIPLRDFSEKPDSVPQGKYLFCTTRRCFMTLIPNPGGCGFSLRSSRTYNWAGWLEGDFLDRIHTTPVRSLHCELIEISAGSARNELDDSD